MAPIAWGTVDAATVPKPTAADIGTADNHFKILEPKIEISTLPTSSITYVLPITATPTVALACSY
jgi:hypothetical protein